LYKENELSLLGPKDKIPIELQEDTRTEGPWRLKCQYAGYVNNPPYTPETFKVEMPLLVKKRTI
jgi:hypothetical protein